MKKKRSRKGPRYFHGDDLTKTALDRKRRSKTEPWEKRKRNPQKGLTTPLVAAIVALILVIGGVSYFATRQRSPAGEGVSAVLAGTSAPLLDFTKVNYDAAVKSDKLIILYFYANWCPICRAEFPVMQKVFNELTTDAVIGFRVNYNDNQTDDDEKNLARAFGVAYQHTKVFLRNSQRILKSPEGWDEKRYDAEINKALAQ